MQFILLLVTLSSIGCVTVREYPIRPFTCESEGGINLSNASLLQVERFSTRMTRASFFDSRRSVEISGEHYSLDSFRPVLMCIDPKFSAELPAMADAADAELTRRYSLMTAAFVMVPSIPLIAATTAVALGLTSTVSGIVGYIHSQLFEPSVEKLNLQSISYNQKVAEVVRSGIKSRPVARLDRDVTIESHHSLE